MRYQQTDRPMDTAYYRDGRTRLKSKSRRKEKPAQRLENKKKTVMTKRFGGKREVMRRKRQQLYLGEKEE